MVKLLNNMMNLRNESTQVTVRNGVTNRNIKCWYWYEFYYVKLSNVDVTPCLNGNLSRMTR